MSQTRTLTEEKQALLARMQSSRMAYRRMLLGTEETQTVTDNLQSGNTSFPKSHTVRWIRDHPFLTALAVAALAIGPRRIVRVTRQRAPVLTSTVRRHQNKVKLAVGIGTALARMLGKRRPW